MNAYKNKTYPLRIDNELMDKIRKICEIEDRPINRQIERIIRVYVQEYEDTHGEIEIKKD